MYETGGILTHKLFYLILSFCGNALMLSSYHVQLNLSIGKFEKLQKLLKLIFNKFLVELTVVINDVRSTPCSSDFAKLNFVSILDI